MTFQHVNTLYCTATYGWHPGPMQGDWTCLANMIHTTLARRQAFTFLVRPAPCALCVVLAGFCEQCACCVTRPETSLLYDSMYARCEGGRTLREQDRHRRDVASMLAHCPLVCIRPHHIRPHCVWRCNGTSESTGPKTQKKIARVLYCFCHASYDSGLQRKLPDV